MTNTLLISEKYVKTQSNIQDNVWGDFLTPAIREAQDIELQPIIGRPLYKKILKEVEEKDVEERFKTLIEDWIQPYLLYQTIVSLIPIIGTKLGNIGTVISNDEHVQNISSSERENLEYRYRYLADHYKSELQKYLLANKDLYPELTSTCLKSLNLKSSNSLPLWTGGVRHGQRETTDCPDKADYADPDGRKAGYIEGGKTVSVTKNNATTTILPSEGYDGISSVDVEVNVPIEESKTVKITENNSTTTISASEGYDGIKDVNVEVNVPIQDKKTVSVTENNSTTTIVPDEGYDGISNVDVNVNVPIQDKKTVEITSTTGTTTIVPDEGYDGMKNVELTYNIKYDKIVVPNGVKLSYLSTAENLFFPYNTKREDILPTKIFDFSLVKNDFSYMFYNSKPIVGRVEHGAGITVSWYEDWSNISFTGNNFSYFMNNETGKGLTPCITKLPKIYCLENTNLESFYNYDGGSFNYSRALNMELNFVNIENVINFKNFYSNWVLSQYLIDQIKVFSEEEIIKKGLQGKYQINKMFAYSKNNNEPLDLDFRKLKNLFENCRGMSEWDAPFYTYGFYDFNFRGDFRGIKGFDMLLASSHFTKYFFTSDYFSTDIREFKITSSKWTDQQNLQEFIDVLPQNTTSRIVYLSSETINALTDEMKSTAANKNWTLAS